MNAVILLRPDCNNINKLLIVDSSMMSMCKHGDIVYKNGAYWIFHHCEGLLNIMNSTCKTMIIPSEITKDIPNILDYYDAFHLLVPNYNLKIILAFTHDCLIRSYYKQAIVGHTLNDHMLIDYKCYVKNFIHKKQPNHSTVSFIKRLCC